MHLSANVEFICLRVCNSVFRWLCCRFSLLSQPAEIEGNVVSQVTVMTNEKVKGLLFLMGGKNVVRMKGRDWIK